MMFNRVRNEKGFTLIELMIVVLVVSILATISVVVYNNFLKQARTVEAKSFLSALARQQTAYYVENEEYTGDLLKLGLPGLGLPELGLPELGRLKYYKITIDVSPELQRYVATASGDIDFDTYLDVWTINQNEVLVHTKDDIKDLP